MMNVFRTLGDASGPITYVVLSDEEADQLRDALRKRKSPLARTLRRRLKEVRK